MRKILSAILLFSLPVFSGPQAFAHGDERFPGTKEINADPVHPGPGQPGDSGGVQGESDMDIFRLNAMDYPLESAGALLRLITGKAPDSLNEFREQNSRKIAQLLFALHKAAESQRITREEYLDITTQLAPFEFRTPYARTHPPGGESRKDTTSNVVDDLVDVRLASDSGDNKKAEEVLASTLEANPQSPSVRTAAADYYNETRNFPLAEKNATAAIALDDKDPDAYKARALARASLDDRKGAIADIKKAMDIDPQDESARVLSALLESRKKVPTLKSVSSVAEIRRALGERTDDEAGSVKGLDVAGGAASSLKAGELAAPDFARSKAYLKTALAKNRLGDYKSAVRYADLAIKKDPANHEAYLERANAYNFLGRYDDAVRDATHVIENDPANMQAFNMRAWALNRKGQSEGAVSDASRAIDLNPGYADAWFNRALAYEKQGDYKSMLEDFQKAASLSGSYSRRYQDAVAQYGPRVPGFAGAAAAGAVQAAARGAQGEAPAKESPVRRFMILMLFTLTGGGLVAAGLIHIMSSRSGVSAAPRSTHPDVLSPSVFYEGVATGKYKIERKLGEGAMGVVYEATDQSLGRKVAIKKMGEEIKVNEREKQRFLEEARTVALLHHPGVVEIYTIFEEESDIYLVFEHVDGQTLDMVLDKEARLPLDRALKIFGEVSAALAYAHAKNVVHRDLKLANIMLSSEGSVKVMDFGLASRVRESMARMSTGEVVGSPAYMAPEQELGTASAQSDIYSLGVCLYEVLSGVMPFPGPDFHQQKSRKSYQRLSEAAPGLPQELDAIIDRCLDPDPDKRYQNADELVRALSLLA